MNHLLKFLILLITLLVFNTGYAAVKASINQVSVYQGDPVTLSITSDENNNAQPDLSPLQKDFDVQGTSTSSQINIINGQRSFKKTWTIELQPKSIGEKLIPAITVGKDTTQPINISINSLPPEVAAETSKHIFLETTVEIADGGTYVQQQIPYKVKLFYDSAMQTGEVFSPKIENANIRSLGNDKKYQVVRAGKKYVVVEKNFVISPEKSGVLNIPPTVVKGRIALSGGDSPKLRRRMDDTDMLNQFFNNFSNNPFVKTPFDELFARRSIGPTRPFTVSGEEISVNVLPVPESFKGAAWLPAEEVVMTDSWSQEPPELKVGEPVTRRLILQVKGLASSQIPEIQIPKPAGMKVYPEQAESETPNDGNTVYGIQRIDISYIPNQEGKVTIPEIEVDWWDVKNKQQKTFTLPEWNLTVAPGAPGSSLPTVNVEPMSDVNPDTEKTFSAKLSDVSVSSDWEVITSIGLGLAALVFILFHFREKLNKFSLSNNANKQTQDQKVNVAEIKGSLLGACKQNDKHMATRLLLKLAKAHWNDSSIQNLGVLATYLDSGNELVRELEKSLYAADSGNWDGSKLYKLVEKGLNKKHVVKVIEKEGLAPLYPA